MLKFKALLSLILLALSTSAFARVTIERIEYRGWHDSYRLTAGEYSLVVVPEIGGRIMEYSYGGQNVIWENAGEFGQTYPLSKDAHDYGGSKLWVTPQEDWSWPPSPMLDFGKANVQIEQTPKGLPLIRVIGCPDLETGVVFTKEISLDDSGDVSITHRLTNISGKTLNHGVWEITHAQTPCLVAFPIKAKSRFPGGITYITAESRNSRQFSVKNGLCVVNYLGEMGKIGADSDGPWMIWFQGNLAFVKLFDGMRKGAEYPDGGCSVQVLTSDAKLGYVEMETMGPIAKLAPGAKSELIEHWRIFRLSQPVKDENRVHKSVKGMQGKGWLP